MFLLILTIFPFIWAFFHFWGFGLYWSCLMLLAKFGLFVTWQPCDKARRNLQSFCFCDNDNDCSFPPPPCGVVRLHLLDCKRGFLVEKQILIMRRKVFWWGRESRLWLNTFNAINHVSITFMGLLEFSENILIPTNILC